MMITMSFHDNDAGGGGRWQFPLEIQWNCDNKDDDGGDDGDGDDEYDVFSTTTTSVAAAGSYENPLERRR